MTRPDSCTLEFCDTNGEKTVKSFKAEAAAIVLHEMDHLDGIILTDKAVSTRIRKDFVTYARLEKILRHTSRTFLLSRLASRHIPSHMINSLLFY